MCSSGLRELPSVLIVSRRRTCVLRRVAKSRLSIEDTDMHSGKIPVADRREDAQVCVIGRVCMVLPTRANVSTLRRKGVNLGPDRCDNNFHITHTAMDTRVRAPVKHSHSRKNVTCRQRQRRRIPTITTTLVMRVNLIPSAQARFATPSLSCYPCARRGSRPAS